MEDDSKRTVSVVVPAYNAEGTIERALDSIRAQTCESIIETIVVDDGSTDGTAQIIREKYPDITLIQQENAGSPTARNLGVEAASGEYIAFLDDDDQWFPDKTSVQMMCFRECPGLRMTIADSVKLDDDEARPDDRRPEHIALEPLTFTDIFPSLPFHYGCSGWVLDRALFAESGGFALHMRRSQDTEWLWRVALRGHAIALVRGPLYGYYPGHLRRSREKWASMWRTWYEGLQPVVEEMAERATHPPARLTQEQADRKRAEFYWAAAWNMWPWGLRDEARQCLGRVVQLSDADGLRGLAERFAAWQPGLYNMILRLRTGRSEMNST